MAMLWMVVVALVAACDGHPGLIGDLDHEFYSEVRDLLSKHAIHQVSVSHCLSCSIGAFGRPPRRKHVLPCRKYEQVLTKINTMLNAPSEYHESQCGRDISFWALHRAGCPNSNCVYQYILYFLCNKTN
jgi:hypothetical protein